MRYDKLDRTYFMKTYNYLDSKNPSYSQMKNDGICLKLFLIGIFTIGLLGMNNAFADVPAITVFVADDPDDLDVVYSDDDTFTLTFSLPINVTASATMSQAAIDGNFTLSGGTDFGTTYEGLWSADRLTLVITVTDITAATDPVIATTTIVGCTVPAPGCIGHAAVEDNPTGPTISPALSGDYGLFVAVTVTTNGQGSGCDGDCWAPTLGLDEKNGRVVENGFTYNGNTINVERYFTPYPLITVDVGKQNYAVFKIYDNLGPDNVRHFDLAFGLATGQVMGTSNVIISWDKSFAGTETISVVDPRNTLDNVRVFTSEGKCRADSAGNDCLIVTVYHTFRESLDFDMVGTNVWDYKRNAWQNFYNHGIHIEGESLNPPDEYVGIHKGKITHLFETGKNTAVDEAGNTWTFDKTWRMDYIPKAKIVDGYTQLGIDRNNAWFNIYKQGQELLAQEVLDQLCPSCSDKEFAEISDVFAYEFPKRIDKLSDPEIQYKMLQQSKVAENTLLQIFDSLYGNNQY